MTSIEDTFSSDSSSSSFSSLSALANNLPALKIESENELESSKVASIVIASETSKHVSSSNEKETASLAIPKTKLQRVSIDSNFYAEDVNYGELENTSLVDLKKSIIKRNRIAENPNIEFAEKLNKPIVEFLDLDTNMCRVNSLVIDYAKNKQSLAVTDEDGQLGEKSNQTKVSLTNSLTDVNEDLINEKNNEIGRVTKWATGFEKLLEDPLGLKIFSEFLKKEFSQENIDFWVKCENFKKIENPLDLKKAADEIWNTYLDTSSMYQINVDSKARGHSKDALIHPNNKMFEMAQTHIFNLMKYDSYSRFLKSQLYKDCIVNEMEGRPLLSKTNAIANKFSNKPANFNENNTIAIKTHLNNDIIKYDDDNIPATASNSNNVALGADGTTALLSSSPNNDQANKSPNTANTNSTSVNNLNTNDNNNDTLNRKEKKRSTILPWTKGKEKKTESDSNLNQPPYLSCSTQNLGTTSIGKASSLKINVNQNQSAESGSKNEIANYSQSQTNLDASGFSNISGLVNQIENKYCRVLCSSDGSSTMIQVIPGQTVYQALNKIFIRKNVPWFKCDLYYVGDYQPIDPQMDAQYLGSKEICLVERCLFIISLIPISINLCVKSNLKKSIQSTIQPILDFYQIQTNNCSIHLNTSANFNINLKDPCSTIDNQHLLIANKHQNILLSHTELDKYTNVSLNDFIPANFHDFQLQFDELGILKKFNLTLKKFIPNAKSHHQVNNLANANFGLNNSNQSLTSLNNIQDESIPEIKPVVTEINNKPRLILKSVGEDQEESKQFIDLLKKAQNHSLDDQRGRIDSQHLEIPEFLLSHNLIKSHSKSQNVINCGNNLNDSINFKVYKNSNYAKCNFNNLNKSTVSLPVTASNFLNTNIPSNMSTTSSSKLGNLNFNSNTLSRSRSPIVIVYDNEDYNLNKTEENISNVSQSEQKMAEISWENAESELRGHTQNHENNYKINQKNYINLLRSPVNYESISENNTPIRLHKNLTAKLHLEESNRSHQIKSISTVSLEKICSENNQINSKISYV